MEGQERKRQTKLGFRERFYIGDGFFPNSIRFVAAFPIVGVVVLAGHFAGGATVTIYNGLAATFMLDISGQSKRIGRYESNTIVLPPGTKRTVSTMIKQKLVETTGRFGDYDYNISHANPLIEWSQVYGNASGKPVRFLGAPCWFNLAGFYVASEQVDWDTATKLFKKTLSTNRGRKDTVAVDLYRLY